MSLSNGARNTARNGRNDAIDAIDATNAPRDMPRTFFLLGSLFAFLAVAAGAFGAHSLKAILPAERLSVFETAVRYQMYHALGLFAVGWASQECQHVPLRIAGWLFVLGILLFSGSLYVLAFSGARWIGALMPLGGLAFLAGWVLLGWGCWKSRLLRE